VKEGRKVSKAVVVHLLDVLLGWYVLSRYCGCVCVCVLYCRVWLCVYIICLPPAGSHSV
jgi:hypothetical protein